MRRLLIPLLVAMMVLVPAAGRPGNVYSNETASFCADTEEQAFLTLINDYRITNDLEPLVLSQTLSAAAEHHSEDMATNDFLGHEGSDGSTVEERFVAHGYTEFTASAENVFAGGESAAAAFDSWRMSPGHNANMLSPDAKAIGIARFFNADSLFNWYWTTTFGSDVDAAACLDGARGNAPAGATDNDDNATGADATDDEDNTAGADATDDEDNTAGADATDDEDNATGAGATDDDDPDPGTDERANTCLDAEEQAFLVLINNHRTANGQDPLAAGPALSAAADTHSRDMATNEFLGHTGSDGSTVEQRLTAHGYTEFGASGENVFAGDESAAGAFDAWLNSPGHNENMLSPDFAAIGIARVFNDASQFGWYWTTTFGSDAEADECGGVAMNGLAPDTGMAGDPPAGDAGDESAGTNPVDTDTGANDGADSDGDGVFDSDEIEFFGTDPNNFDTDGGGVGDGDEIYFDTDPLDPNDDASLDRDGDGLLNEDETDFFETDPDNFDTDGDDVGDGEEVFNGTDPLDPNDS
jgi:uncharacterized protein YkwD